MVIQYPEERFEPEPLDHTMVYWIALDRSMIGARTDSGFVPPDVVERVLDREGIHNLINRDVSRQMLTALAFGRNQALAEKVEPERGGG